MQLNVATPADLAYIPTIEEDNPDNAPIPEMWTPDHVGRRMVDAYRIDRRMPRIARPKAPGSAHPQVEYSDEEKAEWEAVPIDPARFTPNVVQIAQMESAFGWLQIMRPTDWNAHYALKNWAACKAGGGSVRKFCKQHGLDPKTFRDRKERAARLVSSRLNADNVAVF